MIARVKTTVIDTTQAMTVARQIALQSRSLRGSAAAPAGPIDLSYWYGTEHLHALAALVAPIARVDDVNLRRFLQVAFSVTRSEEHTSELQSLMLISYAVFCLKQKTLNTIH